MALTTAAELAAAMNASTRQVISWSKASASSTGGGFLSSWRLGGIPGSGGSPPTSPAAVDASTSGGITYRQAAAGKKLWLAETSVTSANGGMSCWLHDRLAHVNGLVGNITTQQNFTLDPAALGVSVERIGAADYSDVTWWFEWYSQTGSTLVTARVNVTFSDETTGFIDVAFQASMNNHRLQPIDRFNYTGKYIKRIDSIQLLSSTGTGGSFGLVALRGIHPSGTQAATKAYRNTALMALSCIPALACLFIVSLPVSSTSGTFGGRLTLVEA